MMYTKPKNVRFVDMCIWIDNNAYKEDCDEEKLFQYLYLLAHMLARKEKYFRNTKDYDDFAVYMATRTYFRLTNPKQYQLKANGEPKMTKLRSVLNYMRSTLYPCKVDFQQQYYAQTNIVVEDIDYVSEYSFADKLKDTVDELTAKDFEVCLLDVVKTARGFLSKIPYKKDSADWMNIYTSCMLTFLNSITLTNDEKSRIENYKRSMISKDNFYINLYNKEAEDAVILFHLPETMHDYIEVLVRKMKRAIASDLSFCLKTYIPSNQGLEMLVIPTLNGEVYSED